tara:strand:+ start:942 stop:1466 length:525 start_codon:yes stop_codon:yes gene_type:complete
MKNIITLKANDSVFEYSEKPKELKSLLNEIEFQAEQIGLGSLDNPKPKNKYKLGMQYKIIIKRNDKEIDFDFTESINSTWGGSNKIFDMDRYFMIQRPYKQIKDLLYSVLACCKMDYYIEMSFPEFCDEFGYEEFNSDGMKWNEKTKALYNKCIKQSLLLKEIFSEDEIEYLPN